MKKLVKVQVLLSPEQKEELDRIHAETRVPVSTQIRQIVSDYLKKGKQENDSGS
jgi:hypothetical protein